MAQRALAAKAVFILSIAFVLPLVARASALPAIAQQPTPESAPQATPTPDATATVLQKEKLTQEVEQLRRQNGRGWFWANGSALATSVLTALVAVAVAIFGFMQWRGNQREARAQR